MMADFRRWSDALVGTLAAEIDVAGVGADLAEMSAFFFTVAEQRRRDPEDDLISAIAAATADGEQLSTMEVVLFCILLLVAGNETTTNLLGNLQHAFWDHPDQWRSEEHTSELQSLMRISYAVFCLKKKNHH